ncbi:hypothetical protein BCV69DRAFT_153979 [Microstroma glucosiphilum]|uniref:Uncharacterized protein n=1 Tax=Pseudomicrostroma glucosiphilum TaxID=1684307 RepID=A0A316UBD3_9BASI|nr:hypothetical protein BCV69DRAFT_153979 [Pseudomicrostroma glucosiphilum]PWN21761.1 hypothetical protein BCV69DRAFT_153979 [Pseudomicrostroma glucosiphilum]
MRLRLKSELNCPWYWAIMRWQRGRAGRYRRRRNKDTERKHVRRLPQATHDTIRHDTTLHDSKRSRSRSSLDHSIFCVCVCVCVWNRVPD